MNMNAVTVKYTDTIMDTQIDANTEVNKNMDIDTDTDRARAKDTDVNISGHRHI